MSCLSIAGKGACSARGSLGKIGQFSAEFFYPCRFRRSSCSQSSDSEPSSLIFDYKTQINVFKNIEEGTFPAKNATDKNFEEKILVFILNSPV